MKGKPPNWGTEPFPREHSKEGPREAVPRADEAGLPAPASSQGLAARLRAGGTLSNEVTRVLDAAEPGRVLSSTMSLSIHDPTGIFNYRQIPVIKKTKQNKNNTFFF